MTRDSVCPPPEELEQLLLGLLPDESAAGLERHVLACDICLGRAKTLNLQDGLTEAMRGRPFADKHGTEIGDAEDFIRRLQSLRPMADGKVTGQAPGSDSRYRPLRFHASGGLGEVFLARDQELSRAVALKRIRAARAGDAESRRRFLREAEITASLEHPGVVPVYGLTRDADGQLCYAMRFIRGQTLQEALEHFHAELAKDRDPSSRLALRQLLTRFVAVCNTMGYVHSQGVVHRDLKPANILLGEYGETLIVDWGLAKRFGPPGQEPLIEGEPGTPTPAGERADTTKTGHMFGTPTYMSPEQAAGRWHAVGPASDIYSLGVTLYTLLTNRPPILKAEPDVLRERVGAGDFPPPRQVHPSTPPALEAICLKAMALLPERRYATAQEMARDVERWLAGERVWAYAEPWMARAGRWLHQHRTLTASATAVVVFGLLMGGAVGFWLWREREAVGRDVGSALQEAASRQARAEWPEARSALERAAGRLGRGGPASLQRQLEQVRADLELVARLDEIRQQRSARVREEKRGPDFSPPVYAALFRDHGFAVDGTPLPEQIRSSAIKDLLIAALDEWAWYTEDPDERDRLLAAVRQLDPHPWRDRFRDPAVWKNRAALTRLAVEAPLAELTSFTLAILGAALGRTGGDQEAILRRAQLQYPNDFWLNFDLSLLLGNRRLGGAAGRLNWEEAVGFCRAALATRPSSSLAWTQLGVVLGHQGKYTEVEVACRGALRLQPDNPPAGLNLSNALCNQGKYVEAEAVDRELIRLQPHDPRGLNNLSRCLREQGKLAEAETAAREAIQLRPEHASAWCNLGGALMLQDRHREAEAACREGVRLAPQLADAHTYLAEVLRKQGLLEEAEIACREAVRLRPDSVVSHIGLCETLLQRGRLTDAETAGRTATETAPGYAPAHLSLAAVLSGRGQIAGAESACREAIRLQPGFARAHSSLGVLCLEQGRLAEAAACHREATRLRPDEVVFHINAAATLRELGQFAEAEAHCRSVLRLRPTYAEAHFHLGLVQLRQSDYRGAEASFRDAIRLRPDYAAAHFRLGSGLLSQGKLAEALASFRRGHELGHKQRGWSYPSAEFIRRTERLLQREERLPAVLQGKAQAEDPAEMLDFAGLCLIKRLAGDALRLYAAAFAARPVLAEHPGTGHHFNAACAAALAAAAEGKATEAERAIWRGQALDWLRTDLTAWARQIEGGTVQTRAAVREHLQHWQTDPDLAALRVPAALARLPRTEQELWSRLWADVADQLGRACGRSGPHPN